MASWSNRGWRIALAAGLIAAGSFSCQKEAATDDEGIIDYKPIAEQDPDADQPMVEFPAATLTDDASLNQFISDALKICAIGDYDKFRQLFASTHRPPEQDDFKRIWHGVQGVFIQSVHGPVTDRDGQVSWYVHALVRLRKPDSRNRNKRDAVVAVFKEEGEWRMGAAPQGAVRKILAASTQPEGAATSRPSSGPGQVSRGR